MIESETKKIRKFIQVLKTKSRNVLIRRGCLSIYLSCFRFAAIPRVPEKVRSFHMKRSNILSNSLFTVHMINVI